MTSRREWLDWNPQTDALREDVAKQVTLFDPVDTNAGHAAADWLKAHGLSEGARIRLLLVDDQLVGFYVLTVGQVELNSGHKKAAGVPSSTTGAVLLAWIGKAKTAPKGVGEELFLDAVAQARRIHEVAGVAVLVLDPYDEGSETYWRTHWPALRPSKTTSRQGLRRLWMPIS